MTYHPSLRGVWPPQQVSFLEFAPPLPHPTFSSSSSPPSFNISWHPAVRSDCHLKLHAADQIMPKKTSCCNIWNKGDEVLPFLAAPSEVIEVPSKEENPSSSSNNDKDDKEGASKGRRRIASPMCLGCLHSRAGQGETFEQAQTFQA
jgi:hypothetical protein